MTIFCKEFSITFLNETSSMAQTISHCNWAALLMVSDSEISYSSEIRMDSMEEETTLYYSTRTHTLKLVVASWYWRKSYRAQHMSLCNRADTMREAKPVWGPSLAQGQGAVEHCHWSFSHTPRGPSHHHGVRAQKGGGGGFSPEDVQSHEGHIRRLILDNLLCLVEGLNTFI